VIAVALDARAWDQYSQPLDQFQRCQAQLRAAIGLGLVEAIDELIVCQLFEALPGEGRAQWRSSRSSPPRSEPSIRTGSYCENWAAVDNSSQKPITLALSRAWGTPRS
jgi:hypothetical protein